MAMMSHVQKTNDEQDSRLPRGLTLIEFLICGAIILVLIALLLPATRSSRGAARRTQCRHNLKQIGIALHGYHDMYGSFPPAYTVDGQGQRLHSWRTLILPFMDQTSLYESIDLSKPWDDPANSKAFETLVSVYRCPSADVSGAQTIYIGHVGADYAFAPETGQSLSEFEDGASQTGMVYEVPAQQAIHWMSPQDREIKVPDLPDNSLETAHAGLIQMLMADGAVHALSLNLERERWDALKTIAGDHFDEDTP